MTGVARGPREASQGGAHGREPGPGARPASLLRVAGWLALAALLAALGTAAFVWRGSELLLRAGRSAPPDAAADAESALGIGFEEVSFPTAGGIELGGWFIPSAFALPYGVVFVHGAGSDLRAFLDHVRFLHAAGYALLLFDPSSRDASADAAGGSGFGHRELHDVSAAVRHLKRQHGIRRAAAFGISFGANAVLLAAAGDPDIDMALAESPWASVDDLVRAVAPPAPGPLQRAIARLALLRAGARGEPWPIDVIGRIAPRPVVLIGSAEDREVTAASVEALFAKAAEPKELWVAERGERGALFAAQPEEYRERVLTYLGRWLGPAARLPAATPETSAPR
jgi:dienelactone hydrolase